jgi:hypothetical protein
MIRNIRGQTYPSALQQLRARVYRWESRYREESRLSDIAEGASIRAICRVMRTRGRLQRARLALEEAKRG